MNFDLKPLELYKFFNKYVIKQESAKKALANAICSHYKRLQYENAISTSGYDKIPKSNLLLIGPTGVGKTYLIELAAERVGVPWTRADATKYTEAGYVGGNVEDIIKNLLISSNNWRDTEYGIVFIDEIDKVARPDNLIGWDVSRGGVQEALLKIVEGTDVWINALKIDTKDILFIFSGAFEDLDEIMQKRIRSGMGFAADIHSRDGFRKRVERGDIKPTLDDFIEFGMDKQFIGRIPNISFLEYLNSDDLYKILSLPDCPVIIGKKREFMGYGITLDFEEGSLRLLASRAEEMKTGARGLKNVIDDALKDYLFYLPSTDFSSTFGKLTITEEMLDNPEGSLTSILNMTEKYKNKQRVMGAGASGQTVIMQNRGNVFHIDHYKTMLGNLGVREEFIDPAAKYGTKLSIPPKKISDIIMKMFHDIDSYEKNFKNRFGPRLLFSNEAKQTLIIGTLETGGNIGDYIYHRIGKYLEKKELWKGNHIPEIYIEPSILTNPASYVSKFNCQK